MNDAFPPKEKPGEKSEDKEEKEEEKEKVFEGAGYERDLVETVQRDIGEQIEPYPCQNNSEKVSIYWCINDLILWKTLQFITPNSRGIKPCEVWC